MSYYDLRRKVLLCEIGIYLIGPGFGILILGILSLLGWHGDSKIKILIFTVFIILWSLWFPGKKDCRRRLNKSVVDFWYYSLALCGVVLFFMTGAAQREKIALQVSYHAAIASLTNLENRKKFLHQIQGQGTPIFLNIREQAQSRADSWKEVQAECSAMQWAHAQRRGEFRNQFRLDRDWRNRQEKLKIDDPQEMCDAAMLRPSVWEYLSKATTIDELQKIFREHSIDSTYTVLLMGRSVPINDALGDLLLASDPHAMMREFDVIDSDISIATTRRDNAKERYRIIGDLIEKDSAAILWNQVAAFLWPYILITALGMKLAREPYAYSE